MKHARSEASIYALVDPCTDRIRYIGVTVKSLNSRLWRHIEDAKLGGQTRRERWIRKLLASGFQPQMKLLEANVSRDREIYWIAYFRKEGCDLTNLTNGGDGMLGYKHRPEFVAALIARNTGNSPSLITRQRIAASLRGMKASEQTRRKLSLAKKGKPKSLETRGRMSAAMKGLAKSIEHKKNLSLAAISRGKVKRDKLIPAMAQVEAIARYNEGGCTTRSLAKEYSVSATLMCRIIRGGRNDTCEAGLHR